MVVGLQVEVSETASNVTVAPKKTADWASGIEDILAAGILPVALLAKLAGRLSLAAQPAGGSRALGAAFRATVRTKRWRLGVEEDAAGRLGMVVPRFEGRRFRIRTPSCFGLRVVSWLWSLWILVAAGALKLCSSSVFFHRPGHVRSPSVCAARLNLLGKDVGRDSCRSRPPAPSPRLWYISLR